MSIEKIIKIFAIVLLVICCFLALRWRACMLSDDYSKASVMGEYAIYDLYDRGRIDLNGAMELDDVASGGSGKTYLCDYGSHSKACWSTEVLLIKKGWYHLWIRFTPVQSGEVSVMLRGGHYDDFSENQHAVYVDAVSSAPVDLIRNGSFETRTINKYPTSWYCGLNSDDPEGNDLINAKKRAYDGTYFIHVWHDAPLEQTINVEKGVRYTITAHFRKK